MGHIAVSQRVIARNNFGQFISKLEAAANGTMAEAEAEGVAAAKALAPVDTGALVGSIVGGGGGHTAQWSANTPYAMAQEVGSVAHLQTGHVRFFWENEGRDWTPGDNMIRHPGNPAVHYLKNSYEAIMGRIMQIAKRNYPG